MPGFSTSSLAVSFPRSAAAGLLLAALCAPAAAQGGVTVREVKVLGSRDVVEIEVEASSRVTPQTRVLTGPDRLVIDFPNAVPGPELRSQSIDRGQVKDVRFGLFQSKPPVTRLVLDLKTAQSYQIFPSGKTTIIKVTGGSPDTSAGMNPSVSTQPKPALVAASYTPGSAQAMAPLEPIVKPLEVTFREGMLVIKADKATLSEVLSAVQQRTGAEIAIPPGADQEKVVVDLGPAAAPEVLAELLHGAKFNFLIISSTRDPRQLDRVILTPRGEGGSMPLTQVQNNNPGQANNDAVEDDAPVPPQPPAPVAPVRPPDANNPPEDNTPDQ